MQNFGRFASRPPVIAARRVCYITRKPARALRMGRLPREFFARYTPYVAREMLGMVLVRVLDTGTRIQGRIVETEAYRGSDDPASHAYRGVTRRTEVMFGEAGHAYIYFSYGFHYCLNVTTEEPGHAGAVLIRAVEPLRGLEEMHARRADKSGKLTNLTNGPGKLTQAMAIDLSLNREDLVTSKRLYLLKGRTEPEVVTSPRIGISAAREVEWRYYVSGNPFVSHGRNA